MFMSLYLTVCAEYMWVGEEGFLLSFFEDTHNVSFFLKPLFYSDDKTQQNRALKPTVTAYTPR